MKDVYIKGVGMSRFGKREESLVEIMAEAATRAIEDSGRKHFDAVYVGAMNPEDFVGESNISSAVVDYLGLVPVPTTRVETASSSGAAAFDEAIYAVASGYFDSILVIAGEKMSMVSTSVATKILSEVIDHEERRYGLTMPALAALVTRAYMNRYKLKHKDLALVSVKNHLNALKNPYAHFHKEITVEDVLNSKVVADPLRLYDCSPLSDGAASIVLTSEKTKIKVRGLGHGSDYVALSSRKSITSLKSTTVAAEKAFKVAGLMPQHISFAEIHDAFTPFEIIGSEDIGFFPPGKGWIPLVEGRTGIDGDFPINPSGGLKARGHPVGASGLAQLVEAVWQLRGEAGERQIKREPRYALTQSVGGLASNNVVIILERVSL